MPHVNHTNQEWIRRALCLLVVILLLVSACFIYAFTTLPSVGAMLPRGRRATSLQWAKSPALNPSVNWSVFEGRPAGPSMPPGSLVTRFRLAGTFVEYGPRRDLRKAVLDNLKTGTQTIVSENQRLTDDITVISIFRDTVLLRGPAGEEQLRLRFSEAVGSATAAGAPGQGSGSTAVAALAGIDRFGGRRIGERRWVFRRKTLEDYYSELMEEPERLVQVFDSLKPLYDKNRKITGYTLGVEGEAGFFKSAGLRKNDIIRSVNSRKMTNRRHAEYFIREFVHGRANAFVLEVERDGKINKHIYQTR